MKTRLLIDADILAYRASASNQRSYDWDGDGKLAVAADERASRRYAEEELGKLVDRLKADEVTICLSDDFSNFRTRIDPTYKAVRNDVERPVHLYDIKDWLAEEYETDRRPHLEADDVMGILATDPDAAHERRIIVSADKDMMTIPGLLYRPQIQRKKTPTILNITPLEAIRFHFWQAIVGDITDGYGGAPGVGAKSIYAADVLEAESEEEAWDIVLQAFALVGLSEDAAVVQARLARILQHTDYDGNSPILWLPPAYEEE